MSNSLRQEAYRGREIQAVLMPLAQLRIAVFEAFPYLYQGSVDYEMDYLRTYTDARGSLLHAVWDGEALVGATTCIPLHEETEDVQTPFLQAGMDLGQICYFGESILLPAYRGHGLGKTFFDVREAHARALGLSQACFCAVDRPANHPLCPADYRPLDTFWQQRGYRRMPELSTTFTWQDIDEAQASPKPMTFWMHAL